MQSSRFQLFFVLFSTTVTLSYSCKTRTFHANLKQDHSATGIDGTESVTLHHDPILKKHYLSKKCQDTSKFEVVKEGLIERFNKETNVIKAKENRKRLEAAVRSMKEKTAQMASPEESAALAILQEQLTKEDEKVSSAESVAFQIGALFIVTTFPVCTVHDRKNMEIEKNQTLIAAYSFLKMMLDEFIAHSKKTTSELAASSTVIDLRAEFKGAHAELGMHENSVKFLFESSQLNLALTFPSQHSYRLEFRDDLVAEIPNFKSEVGTQIPMLVFQRGNVLEANRKPQGLELACVLSGGQSLRQKPSKEQYGFAANRPMIFSRRYSTLKIGQVHFSTENKSGASVGSMDIDMLLHCGTVSYVMKEKVVRDGIKFSKIQENTGVWHLTEIQDIYASSLSDIFPEDIGLSLRKIESVPIDR